MKSNGNRLNFDNLIKTFCHRFNNIIKHLETCEVDSSNGGVETLPVVEGSIDDCIVWLVYSNGIEWHTDTEYATTYGVRYCHMFVLRNPGYIFKRRLAKGQIEAHEKPFFSFNMTKSHGLFWNHNMVSKNKRKNWIGLSIDSKKCLDEAQCCEILRKIISMSLNDFIYKRLLLSQTRSQMRIRRVFR
jgi:hypothetical protein